MTEPSEQTEATTEQSAPAETSETKPRKPRRPARTPEELRDELLAKRAAIDARLQDINHREREAERKRDTRRKILVGGYILATLPDSDAKSLENWLLNEQRVVNHTQERDRETIIATIKEAGARRPPLPKKEPKEPPAAQGAEEGKGR